MDNYTPQALHVMATERQANEGFRFEVRNWFCPQICPIERGQITADARLDFFHAPLQLGAGEVPVAVVQRLEFTTVNGNQVFAKQSQLLAE